MVEDKSKLVARDAYTHEIRDGSGEWIWLGDQLSMQLIFRNLPVGFLEREVTGADAARAVGATQRELPESA